MVDHSNFIRNFRADLILKMPSVQSPVRMANSIVGAGNATSTHNIISVNVEDPISEVAADGIEDEDNLTYLLKSVADPKLLTYCS